MEIRKIAIVGAGAMGSGIATAFSMAGIPVLLKDVTLEAAQTGLNRIVKTVQGRLAKGQLTPEKAEQIIDRVTVVADYDWFDQVDLVIEAAAEDIEVKHEIFRALDEATPAHCILATNTSSLSVTWIASATKRPQKVVGLHFFNPAHVMRLVEVVAGLDTAQTTIDLLIELCHRIGKLAVRVEECASFLVNRLLGRYSLEALYILQDQIATPQEIDHAAIDMAMPMGPVSLRDFTGIDIGYHVAQFNFREYGPRFEPAPLLKAMFDKGWLGQKTLKGFYEYDAQTRKPVGLNSELPELLERFPRSSASFDPRRLFLPMINEALLVLQEHIVKPTELDAALMAGLGMRKGPLKLAEEIGLAECLRLMEQLFEEQGERFRPAPLLKRLVWGHRTLVIG